MILTTKLQMGEVTLFVGRKKGNLWIVSNQENTKAPNAAVLETEGTFSVREIADKYRIYQDIYNPNAVPS